jgi:glucokinase
MPKSSSERILLGDIGATNARFALLEGDELSGLEWMTDADYPQFADAVCAFVERRGHPRLTAALLAVAGPVHDNRSRLTNRPWLIDGSALRQSLRLEWVRIVNDFEATAWSLSHLKPPDLRQLGAGHAVAGAPLAVLGPGTGLGVSCYVPAAGRGWVLPSEGGHVTLPSTSAREDLVIERLRERFGYVSSEHAVSGMGLEHLYQAIAAIADVDVPERRAADITRAALDGTCPTSRTALDLFCAFLGSIAGDVALTFGARGGVYIAGGIAPRIIDFLERSEFRARFEAKGRSRSYVESIPTHVIVHPAATFVGLQALFQQSR